MVHDDPEWVGDVVRLLTDTFETPMGDPWSVDDAPADWLATMLRGIVGIELVDVRVEGKAKLSQNRSVADRTAVADGVADAGVATAMRATLDG